MRCRTVRRQLPALESQELNERRAKAVEQHLAVCAACAEYAEELRLTRELLGAGTDIEPSAGFAARVQARLRQEKRGAGRPVFEPALPRWAVPAALGAALLLGGIFGALEGRLAARPPALASPQAQVAADWLGLEAFRELPSDSLGGAYVHLAWSPRGEGQ